MHDVFTCAYWSNTWGFSRSPRSLIEVEYLQESTIIKTTWNILHSKKQNITEGKQICLTAKENNFHPWFAPSGAIFFPRLWCDFQKHVPYILARSNYKTLNILYYILTINFVYIVIFLMTLIYSYVSNKNLYKN
jgi:hypothetical protein